MILKHGKYYLARNIVTGEEKIVQALCSDGMTFFFIGIETDMPMEVFSRFYVLVAEIDIRERVFRLERSNQ